MFRTRFERAMRVASGSTALVLWVALPAIEGCRTTGATWRDRFTVNKADLRPTGGNAYFSLTPGAVFRYEAGDQRLVITVLDETRVVDGVTTRVIEEREEAGEQLIEVSRNFFAADPSTGDVYYFGEEVDIYENGEIVSHEGAWLSGENGARFGLIMPGEVVVGDRYYQELAPGVALDRAENISVNETLMTPAGTFTSVLLVEETTPLEPGEVSRKWYAPDVGLIADNELLLVEYSVP